MTAAYIAKKKEEIRAKQAEWRDRNRDALRGRNRAYHARTSTERRAKSAAYRKAKPEIMAAWREKNRLNVLAYNAAKRALRRGRRPKWANQFFIDEIYRLARLRTKLTGIVWHVDHIVPLQSQFVCGLHVEHNLRVIPAVENLSKHNRHWPDMP